MRSTARTGRRDAAAKRIAVKKTQGALMGEQVVVSVKGGNGNGRVWRVVSVGRVAARIC